MAGGWSLFTTYLHNLQPNPIQKRLEKLWKPENFLYIFKPFLRCYLDLALIHMSILHSVPV